jgi:hypothetical protein
MVIYRAYDIPRSQFFPELQETNFEATHIFISIEASCTVFKVFLATASGASCAARETVESLPKGLFEKLQESPIYEGCPTIAA